MNEKLTSTETIDLVTEGLRNLQSQHGNDFDLTLKKLQIPANEIEQTKQAINKLLSGDETLKKGLIEELDSTETKDIFLLSATKGGVTKFKILTKFYIPYGAVLYIDHKTMDNAQDIGQLVTAITACFGPEAAPLVLALAVGLAALKVLDRGNGIKVTQIPFPVGPSIPTPQ